MGISTKGAFFINPKFNLGSQRMNLPMSPNGAICPEKENDFDPCPSEILNLSPLGGII